MSQAKSYLSLHMKEAAADVDPDKMLASRKIMEQVPPNSSLAPWLQRIPFLQVRVALAVGWGWVGFRGGFGWGVRSGGGGGARS